MRNRMVVAVVVAMLLAGTIGSAQEPSRTEKIAYPQVAFVGLYMWTCGEGDTAFNIMNDLSYIYRETNRYDKTGTLVQTIGHLTITLDALYNEKKPSIRVYGIPGEHQINRIVWADGVNYGKGPSYDYVLPGQGPVFHNAGNFTYQLSSGVYLVFHGPNDFITGDYATVCEYLK